MAVVFSGCNPFLLPFYLTRPEPTLPPKLKRLADKDEDIQKTCAVLAWTDLGAREDLLHADREIAMKAAKFLNLWVKKNEENVKVRHPRFVEEMKNNHPEWKQLSPEELRKLLKVDYLVYLEIRKLDLYETRSSGTLFRGRAEIRVSLISDAGDDEFESTESRELSLVVPKSGPIPRDLDTTVVRFRERLFNEIGQEIAWHFTKHPKSKEFARD